MKISLNWIKEYVDLNGVDLDKLINQFTLSVAEIEDVIKLGENISGVVTAKILEVKEHPNSKKLHLLKVDDGKQVLDIVCGAPNVRVGMVVPLAKVGANISGLTIGVVTLAGEKSYGMCCSEKELGVSDSHEGLMELPDNTPLGLDVKKLYELEDIVIEVDNKSLTNRPDLWGHYGIAREIAALLNRPLKPLKVEELSAYDKLPKLNIEIDTKNCYRYSGMTFENIRVKASPVLMQTRLHKVGMRPINLLTDLTNYLMLEIGQPMHAFDNALVKNIQVYELKNNTEFLTLDGTARELEKGTIVIASSNKPVAVAGVMGGELSGISESTNSVLLESANFDSTAIRKTAIKVGLRTDSSARYEKTLDPEMTTVATARYLHLLKAIDNGVKVSSALTDVYNYKFEPVKIEVTKEYIDKYVGVDISEEEILRILKNLEFKVNVAQKGKYQVLVPSFRATKDVRGKWDIVEEITRIYGYDNIKPQAPFQKIKPVVLDKEIDFEYKAKYFLASKYNFSEVHSYIWYDYETNKELGIKPKSVIKLVNALNKDNSEIRKTIIPSLLKTVLENRTSFSDIKVFEIGRVAKQVKKDGLVDERKVLGLVHYSKQLTEKDMLLEMKNIVQNLVEQELNLSLKIKPKTAEAEYYHPINNYALYVNATEIGEIAVLHPVIKNNIAKSCNVVVAELDVRLLTQEAAALVKFEQVTKFPVTEFDFSFVVPADMLYSEIEEVANKVKSKLNYKVNYVDTYLSDNKVITIKYLVWSNDHTLTSIEIDEFYESVINKFKEFNIFIKA